jgi:hypothetical protein
MLGGAQPRATRLALDCEGGAEPRVAVRAARPHLAAALRARLGKLVREFLEVALHESAREAEGDPVAKGLAPFLPEPVSRATHAVDCTSHLCDGVWHGAVPDHARDRARSVTVL